MCTIGRRPVDTAGNAHHLPDRKERAARDGQGGTDHGPERGGGSFLNTVLPPIAQEILMVDNYDGLLCDRVNVITLENYMFLRDSYFRYARLLRKEAAHTPGNSIGESIARLYDDMDTLVGDGLNVNIEQDGGRLYFRLWKYHQWGSFTLYYFPVKFIESLGPALRRIAVTFMHGLMEANGIGILLGDDDAEFILDQLSERDEDPQEWKGRKRILDSYRTGRAGRLLRRVETTSYYKDLPKAIGAYDPRNGFERMLVDAMRKGLPFLTPERGIMEYAYDAFYSESPDFHPIYLEHQIRVVYDTGDIVSEYLADYYDSYSRETYDITPVTTCDLSPDTGEPFSMDDYPERFFRWAEEFITLTS